MTKNGFHRSHDGSWSTSRVDGIVIERDGRYWRVVAIGSTEYKTHDPLGRTPDRMATRTIRATVSTHRTADAATLAAAPMSAHPQSRAMAQAWATLAERLLQTQGHGRRGRLMATSARLLDAWTSGRGIVTMDKEDGSVAVSVFDWTAAADLLTTDELADIASGAIAPGVAQAKLADVSARVETAKRTEDVSALDAEEYARHIEDVSTRGRLAHVRGDVIECVYSDEDAARTAKLDGAHVERVYWTEDGWTLGTDDERNAMRIEEEERAIDAEWLATAERVTDEDADILDAIETMAPATSHDAHTRHAMARELVLSIARGTTDENGAQALADSHGVADEFKLALAAVREFAEDFASECEWQETADDEAHERLSYWRTMSTDTLLRNASRHYDGGALALVLDGSHELADTTDAKPSATLAQANEHRWTVRGILTDGRSVLYANIIGRKQETRLEAAGIARNPERVQSADKLAAVIVIDAHEELADDKLYETRRGENMRLYGAVADESTAVVERLRARVTETSTEDDAKLAQAAKDLSGETDEDAAFSACERIADEWLAKRTETAQETAGATETAAEEMSATDALRLGSEALRHRAAGARELGSMYEIASLLADADERERAAVKLDAMADKLDALTTSPPSGGCQDEDERTQRRAARAVGVFIERGRLAILRARLAERAPRYSVEHVHSGTEDGYLWDVLRDGVAIEDDGGWLHEEHAIECAMWRASLDRLAAVDALTMDYRETCASAYDADSREHATRLLADIRAAVSKLDADELGNVPSSTLALVGRWTHETRELVSLLAEHEPTEDERERDNVARETLASRLADDASVPDETDDGYAMTAAQRLTVAKLREDAERSWREPCSVKLARYGDADKLVLAIVSCDTSAAPNPIVALWLDGSAHLVYSEEDAETWTSMLGLVNGRAPHGSRVVIERAEDACYVIELGGSYTSKPSAIADERSA